MKFNLLYWCRAWTSWWCPRTGMWPSPTTGPPSSRWWTWTTRLPSSWSSSHSLRLGSHSLLLYLGCGCFVTSALLEAAIFIILLTYGQPGPSFLKIIYLFICGEAPGRYSNPWQADLLTGTLTTRLPHLTGIKFFPTTQLCIFDPKRFFSHFVWCSFCLRTCITVEWISQH